jgi:MFS family permease
MTNRWLPIAGGILMNLALGSLYAWSVFVLPLEKEFGWTRAQTSWVFTIAIVCFALSFIVAGRIQDLKGPRICAAIGGILVSAGFVLASFTSSLIGLYLSFGVVVGLGNGFGYATPTPVGSKWFPDKRGLVIGLMVGGYGAGSAILGPLATEMVASMGWRPTFQLLGATFFVMTMAGTALLKNPPPGYRPPNWHPSAAAAAGRDVPTREMLATPTFYSLWIAFCLGTTAGPDDHQPAGAVCTQRRHERDRRDLCDHRRRLRQCGRADSVWLDLGFAGPRPHAPDDDPHLRGGDADPVCRTSRSCPVLHPRRHRLLVLRDAAVSGRLDDGRFLRDEESRHELRRAIHGVGAAGILGPAIAARVFDRFGDYRYAFFIAAALSLVACASLMMARPPARAAAHV